MQIDRAFALDMGIYRLKFTMNFLMNLCNHFQIIAALLLGGWWVYTGRLEIGGVVAFISGIGRLNDPWGDLVNYFRDVSVTQVKFRLLANAVNQLAQGVPDPFKGAVELALQNPAQFGVGKISAWPALSSARTGRGRSSAPAFGPYVKRRSASVPSSRRRGELSLRVPSLARMGIG